MTTPRFSVASLMGAVLFFGVSLAAMRSNVIWWGLGLSVAVVLMMATAALMAVTSRGRPRAVWAGIAIFGWAYLFLGFSTDFETLSQKPLSLAILPFSRLYRHFHPYTLYSDERSETSNYIRICHSMLVMIFGLIGAMVGWIVADRGEESSPDIRRD